MPVAIVVLGDGIVPTILSERTAALLLARLRALAPAPDLADEDAAREWLASLPFPGGWYASIVEASLRIRQATETSAATAEEVRQARAVLGLSRADFAEAIGFGGNSNTRHKTIYQVENAQITLSAEAARRLRALLAQHAIAGANERTNVQGREVSELFRADGPAVNAGATFKSTK